MELASYLRILNRRKWIIIMTTVATLVAYVLIQPLVPTTYEATAILRITPYTTSNPSYNTLLYADRIMNNYVKIASSSLLMNQLKVRLGLAPDQPKDIVVDILPDSEMLLISVEDYDPILARDAANTLAEMLSKIMINRDIRISIVDPATIPEPPSAFRIIMLPALLVILGLFGGTGLAFIFENLDTRLFTTEQIEMVSGLTVLGEIPVSRLQFPDNSPLLNDSFRRLRTKLLVEFRINPRQSLIITSAEPKEGKSTIVAHLGRSMALTGRKCIIVDTDLYCPKIHTLFNLPNDVGLSSVLENKGALSDALCETQFHDLFVLTSGPPVPNPTELLGSVQTSALLEKMKNEFDMVLLDTPAFLAAADTAVLASKVDGIILVARCGSIRAAPLQATCKQLEDVHAKPLGLVVNSVKKHLPRSYHKYYQRSMLVRARDATEIQSSSIERSSQETSEVQDLVEVNPEEPILQSTSHPVDVPQAKIPEKDDLKDIKGIGPANEKALNTLGIYSFEHLANQDPIDLAEKIGGKISNRVISEEWIEQARSLAQQKIH